MSAAQVRLRADRKGALLPGIAMAGCLACESLLRNANYKVDAHHPILL